MYVTKCRNRSQLARNYIKIIKSVQFVCCGVGEVWGGGANDWNDKRRKYGEEGGREL